MIEAQATITKEVNVLNTIQFQVAQRRKEIHDKIEKNEDYCSICNSQLYWDKEKDTWFCRNSICSHSKELFKEK